MKLKSSINLIHSFITLLREAKGFKNKSIFLEYAIQNFLTRFFRHFYFQKDIFIEFKEAKVWFGALSGELSSYIEIFVKNEYELDEDFIPDEEDTIFDIGANIGLYTIRQAMRAKNGRLFTFEPSPEVFARLRKNVKVNNLQNVFLFNKAVYSKECNTRLVFNNSSTVTSYIVVAPLVLGMKSVTLDGIINRYKIKRINLMKIDVENSEIEVLKGGEKCLKLTEKIVMECHTDKLKKEVESFLEIRGFHQTLQKHLERTYLLYFRKEKP